MAYGNANARQKGRLDDRHNGVPESRLCADRAVVALVLAKSRMRTNLEQSFTQQGRTKCKTSRCGRSSLHLIVTLEITSEDM